ncbi:MAG: quinolinate synthase [Fimbriimonadaceae bacterium]
MYQQPLPQEYQSLSDQEVFDRISAAKQALGSRLVILGHHYQRDEVIVHADYRGDSYKLAKDAQRHPDAEFIVFCGVHFMAESADILASPNQRVILPNLAAGCSMADMANVFQVKNCWRELEGVLECGNSLPLCAGEQARGYQSGNELPHSVDSQSGNKLPHSKDFQSGNKLPHSKDSQSGNKLPHSIGSQSGNKLPHSKDFQSGNELPHSIDSQSGNKLPHSIDSQSGNKLPHSKEALLPITYINSAANLKAFVGEKGGTVCTSTNAPTAVKWALDRADKVLFFPDQHLGRNTGVKLGYSPDEMVVWNPFKPLGGNTEAEIRAAKFILWKGHCSVHQRFTVEQVRKARAEHPGIQILVHPECPLEVVQESDLAGSTEFIIKSVEASPAGSKWAIGTEINLVSRLAKENPDKTIFCLDPQICPCSTMYRIHPSFLCWVLESLARGEVVNEIVVPEKTAQFASLALDRMLQLDPSQAPRD